MRLDKAGVIEHLDAAQQLLLSRKNNNFYKMFDGGSYNEFLS
jgi:hypothetical protein